MGYTLADRLLQRKKLLEELRAFVERMRAQVSYALVPPDRIIADCDDGEGGFFRCCIGALEQQPIDRAWLYASEHCGAVRTLNAEERRLLLDLGGQLGKYDADLQLSALSVFAVRLEEFCRAASEQHRDRSRLRITCSLLAGALLSILII